MDEAERLFQEDEEILQNVMGTPSVPYRMKNKH